MIDVQVLFGAGEPLVREIPDPFGSVAQDGQFLDVGQANPFGFCLAARAELLSRLNRGDHVSHRRFRQIALGIIFRRAGLGWFADGEGGDFHVAPAGLGVDLSCVDLQFPVARSLREVRRDVETFALGLAAFSGLGMAEPSDRFGVNGPPRQLLERAFAAFKGIVDSDVADLPAGAAGERAVEPECVVSRECTIATRGTRAIGTRDRNLADGGYN